MNSSNKNRPDPTENSKALLSARFSYPIIKVSISNGVICNRIEKFWTEQNIKIKKCAS